MGTEASARGAIAAIAALAGDVGVPASLGEIGIRESELGELGELAEQAMAVTRLLDNNPREAGRPELREMLAAAWNRDLAR
jgi:alcohol dehydrogenase class IV